MAKACCTIKKIINRVVIKSNYKYLLSTKTKSKWQKLGIDKRAGIAVPLFSLYSKSGIGIGEIPDLKLLIDWCKKTGFSIIQLLPLYDMGIDFSPYSAVSSFALDYIYLNLEQLKDIEIGPFAKEIKKLKIKFPSSKGRVDYNIKKAKYELLWKIFKSNIIPTLRNGSADGVEKLLKFFIKENKYWLL